ncbi:MAG: hypothetical protein Kow0088_21090 [Anaerolineales bacterium]
MNKRLIIFGVLLAALLLSAVSPWPATLTVVNKTGDSIYFTLMYRGEQKYILTATVAGNSDTYNVSKFDITRHLYSASVTACSTTYSGTLDMRKNVFLKFVSCDSMRRMKPQFWGEPRFEKPNFYQGFTEFDDKYHSEFYFIY